MHNGIGLEFIYRRVNRCNIFQCGFAHIEIFMIEEHEVAGMLQVDVIKISYVVITDHLNMLYSKLLAKRKPIKQWFS